MKGLLIFLGLLAVVLLVVFPLLASAHDLTPWFAGMP